ncbi:MAG: ATP-binding protein [Clostridiales bacterium]|jgi:DNA replication protein DnaC|nr:ATP-binding protein [Clostridiales bacterium]
MTQYKKAIEAVAQRRREALLDARLYYGQLMDSVPAFAEAERAYRAAVLAVVNGKLAAAEAERLKKKRDAVVKSLKADKLLNPPCLCKQCGDTGLADGRICACALKLITDGGGNIEFPLRRFDELDETLFEESKRPLVRRVAEELKIIVEKGPLSKKKNVCLLGSAGTGKTFLASCAAEEALALNRSVIFITAFTLNKRLLEYHTGFDAGKADTLSPLLDCDLLIVDDLGAESVYKNVTLEYLYHIVNERQLRGAHTFLTSNLSMDDIASRYGARTASRLFDKRLSYIREFDFGDLRALNVQKRKP